MKVLLILCLVCCVAAFAPFPIGGADRNDIRNHQGEGQNVINTMMEQGLSKKEILKRIAVDNSQLRIKEGQVGVYPPKSYSGYVEVNKTYGANLFFWFFLAQNGNVSAPIILWLQGGPGCPSLLGLLIENGPFYVSPKLELYEDPNTWNTDYNMLFIDQPAGVGYSYIENPHGYVTNEQQVADEFHQGLVHFFTLFEDFRDNDFYIFGESYGGKYVPAISYKILQANNALLTGERGADASPFLINLVGLAIGDGLTDPIVQATGYDDFAYSSGLVDEKQLVVVNKTAEYAIKVIKEEKWAEAANAFGNIFQTIRNFSGNPNPLDYRTYEPYNFTIVGDYFNLPQVRKSLGVGTHTFKGATCNDPAGAALGDDIAKSVKHLFPELLANYKVMLYNGQFDLEIALTTSEAWIKTIPWDGNNGYLEAERYVWRNPSGDVAGFARSYKSLTQVIVVGAGHMVPKNQPANAHDMVRHFVEDIPWNTTD